MGNYKEITGNANAWQRCSKVICENPVNGNKGLIFEEQQVISMDGKTVTTPLGTLRLNFEPVANISLYDPNTGDVLPVSISHAYAYQVLYSLYRHAAAARDALPT